MEQAFGFDRRMQELMEAHASAGERPSLLLHVCCAPCSSAVLERVHAAFRVTVLFDNPNMDTAREYAIRAGEAERLAKETGWPEGFILAPYDPQAWEQVVLGLENEPEGGARCAACFRLRLRRSARAAADMGFRWFTTTLTLSPRKDAALLNRIGAEEGEAAGVAFLPSDFKKRNGYLRSLELSRRFGLYRQDYCGCVYSRRAHPARETADTNK
ncbi:MAG TPA: epoxyqueuosine reductase QueH [Candidatus Limnocylindria bacterium]|nr:epoxyqueuosine reductase QueH [Candidatus Limnocylindria bacterium]